MTQPPKWEVVSFTNKELSSDGSEDGIPQGKDARDDAEQWERHERADADP